MAIDGYREESENTEFQDPVMLMEEALSPQGLHRRICQVADDLRLLIAKVDRMDTARDAE